MQNSPPDTNKTIYSILFELETALRELIIDSLASIAGSRWYKSRLPGDVLEKYRLGIGYERKAPWRTLVPHHPLYYVDFPDLKKVIEREDNWRDVFQAIFVRKDFVAAPLADLEPIRNTIAHNRRATPDDVRTAETAYSKLRRMVGDQRFDDVGRRCTEFRGIAESLLELRECCQVTVAACRSLKPVTGLDIAWIAISEAWWFDETYLGESLEKIYAYFQLVTEYERLPRQRGSGHTIEEWVRNSLLEANLRAAVDTLDTLMRSGHGSRAHP